MITMFYCSLLIILSLAIILHLFQSRRFKNLPPCPPTIPIVGNLHLLKSPFHRSFHSLSQSYGPIFSLWLGSRLSVVISSHTLAQQCFTKHDIILANRPRSLVGKHLLYNFNSLASSPYGDHWRNVRRIITTEVLSNHRLNSFHETRRDEVMRVMGKLVEDTCMGFTRVQVRPRMSEMSFNSIMKMVSGKKCYDDGNGDDKTVMGSEEARQFREIIAEIMSLIGASNLGDFLPFLRWFVFYGFVRRLKRISEKSDGFVQRLIEEHRSGKHGNNSMIDHLLTLQKVQPENYSDYIIKGIIQDLLLAGTDTISVTLEWALSALLNNPDMLKKAKNELNTHVGKDRLVDESDIPNLPFLQNIIHETLRLYPPGPMLLPHLSSDECTIGGFTIPRDTTVLINAWATHRDPTIWSDAECFNAERFEKEGESSKVIAFGLGRRACPGLALAHRTMGLALGLLIQCFEWKRLTDEEIDMREIDGANTPKLIPLEALCKALPISKKIKSY